MSRENANSKRAEVVRGKNQRGDTTAAASERAPAGHTRTGFGPLLQRTLNEYCRECAGVMDVKRFDAMVVDGESLVVYERSCFKRDTALGER